jgi:hypothetical protein
MESELVKHQTCLESSVYPEGYGDQDLRFPHLEG